MIFLNVKDYDENTNLYVNTPEQKRIEVKEKSKLRYKALIALFVIGLLILIAELFLLQFSLSSVLVILLSIMALFSLCFQSKFYTLKYIINIIPIIISNIFTIFFPNIVIYSLILFALSNIYFFIQGIKYGSAIDPWFNVVMTRSLFFSGLFGMIIPIIFFISTL